MRILPLLLATLLLGAHAPAQDAEETETIRDAKSGLIVQMPDGWSRDSKHEKGGVRFAGLYDLTPQRYVLFTVEMGPATGFDEAAWLKTEQAAVTKHLKSQDVAWTTEPITVGGASTRRFTVGGKAAGEKEFDLRIRRCGLVRNDVFFRITEFSYGKAHEETADPIKAMWEAIKFEEPNPFAEDEQKDEGSGDAEKPADEGGDAAPKGEPVVIEDKAGNFKIKMHPDWTLDMPPPEDEGDGQRVVMRRPQGSMDVATISVLRIPIRRADFFETHEAGDAVEKLVNDEMHAFDNYFEEGAHKVMRPKVDTRARLGGAEKTCGFEMRGIRLSEEAKIEEVKKLHARGDTSQPIPEYPEIVVTGRLAMVSPYVYLAFVNRARGMAENATLEGEIDQILSSFELLMTEGKPPPLESGEGPLGNTLADPKNATERKVSKVHPYKKGAKIMAELKIDFVLPPGFQEVNQVRAGNIGADVGENVPLQIVAQDENNGWVWITVVAQSAKSLPPNTSFQEKKKVFETWISNFESQARGAGKMPKKPEKVKVGSLDGDGCELEGKINGFHATEFNLVTDDGGWRIQFELKTRGTGAKTFAKQIEQFKKRFKAAKK